MKYADRLQFLANLAYVGSYFYGVQEQPGLKTVLGVLRTRIEEASGQSARALCIAARTDRGVHALDNYATFFMRPPLDIKRFIDQLSIYCDDGLFIVGIKPVGPHVHARRTIGKIYRYTIRDYVNPSEHPFIWEIAPKLSIKSMQKASQYFIGEHDFSSFRGGGCQAGTVIKNIFDISITRNQQGIITIEISGNAFLRKMIRNLVGLLVEVGAGLRTPDDIPGILAQKKRQAAGIMAPAWGLMLVKVELLPDLA